MATLTKITGTNFLRLRAVEFTTDGHPAVVIGGRNEQGKSACLQIVKALLGGAREFPAEPLREGSGSGAIAIDIADAFDLGDLHFERSVSPKGLGSLRITSQDGPVPGGAQALADRFKSSLMFDPMRFDSLARSKPKEAAEILREACGVDTRKKEAKLDKLLADRTAKGREAKRLGAVASSLIVDKDAPDSEVSVSDLLPELDRVNAHNLSNERARLELADVAARGKAAAMRVTDLKESLAEAQAELAALRKNHKAVSVLVGKRVDLDRGEIEGRIAAAESTNTKVRANRVAVAAGIEAGASKAEHASVGRAIEDIRAEIAADIASAKYPIEGLEVTGDGVRLDGLPWSQASTARRIRASTAIGFAQNSELRLLLIEDGSSLDADNLQLVAGLAEEAGGMALIEVVGDGDECSVVIEDGMVLAAL